MKSRTTGSRATAVVATIGLAALLVAGFVASRPGPAPAAAPTGPVAPEPGPFPRSPPPCATEPSRSAGTTYYACDCGPGSAPGCVPGDDARSGTSKSTAWRSWAKASRQFNQMPGGSTVAFCRGGSWSALAGTGPVRNTACATTSTCDMRDYDPRPVWGGGAEGKPVLQFASGQKFMELGWYQKWDLEPVRGIRVLNLDIAGSNDGKVHGVFLWGKVEDLEVCNVTFRDGLDAAYAGVVTSTIRRVNFHHNRIVNNPFGIGVIQGTSCASDCVFDSNFMDLNGGATNRDHSVYVGSSPDPKGQFPDQRCASSGCYITARGIRITNNEIRRSARGAGPGCVGSALVVHEPHDGLVIENNLIYEPPGSAREGCFGIDVSSGNDAPGAFRGTLIRRNRLFNVGGVGIRISECPDCTVENNLVVGGMTTGAGIKYPDERSQPPPDSLESTRGVVRNNTIYAPPGSRSMEVGIRIGALGEGSGYVVANNALWGPRTVLDAGSGVTVDVGNLRSATGKWFKNPGLEPESADFSAEDGGPLLDAGNAEHASPTSIGAVRWTSDEASPRRPVGRGPDIGAFER